MTIISTPLPVTLVNGTTADATQVMSDFNYIVSQTNANAAAIVGGNAFTGTQTINGDTIATLAATQSLTGKTLDGPNGTVGAPTYSFSASTSTGIWSPTTNTLGIATNGTNAVYVDAAQNIGIGTTPSSWALGGNIQTGGNIVGVGGLSIGSNCYFNGTWKYIGTGGAMRYDQNISSGHSWYVASSGSAGGTITFTQVAGLDTSGNLNALGRVSSGTGAWTSYAYSFTAAGGYAQVSAGAASASNAGYWAIVDNTTFRGFAMQLGSSFSLDAYVGNNSSAWVKAMSIAQNTSTTFFGGVGTNRFAIGNSSTLTIDWSKSNFQTLTLTANVAGGGWSFSNAIDGQTITLKITQDATGSRTIAANSAILWPGGVLGVLSTAPGAVDFLTITYDAGTNKYHASLLKGFA
jgi:hypothetical protein